MRDRQCSTGFLPWLSRQAGIPALAAALLIVFGSSCAGSPVLPVAPRPPELEAASVARSLWTRQLDGLVTDLEISANGKVIVAATIPDPDKGGRERFLYRFDARGRQIFQKRLDSQVRSLSVARDGKLIAVSAYDEKIQVMDSRGRRRWTADGNCRPLILSRLKRLLCYHDDDAEPAVAFDVYTLGGRKVLSFPISSDILALKVAPDETHVALALVGGSVLLLDSRFRRLWDRQVPGEVADLAVGPGGVAVLSRQLDHPAAPERLSVFSLSGEPAGSAEIADPAEQIEGAPAGDAFYLYGNALSGQRLTRVRRDNGGWSVQWSRGIPTRSEYSSRLAVRGELVFFPLEEPADRGPRAMSVLAFRPDGKAQWRIEPKREGEQSAYVYLYAPAPPTAVLATDDGYIEAFRLD